MASTLEHKCSFGLFVSWNRLILHSKRNRECMGSYINVMIRISNIWNCSRDCILDSSISSGQEMFGTFRFNACY